MTEFWGFDPVDTDGQIIVCCDDEDDCEGLAPMALALRKMDVPVWYDYGLTAGKKKWKAQVEKQIRRSNALVLYISDFTSMFFEPDSYAMWEYETARSLGKPVIPVICGDWIFGDEFMEIWREDYPETFEKRYDGFLEMINSDYVKLDEDEPKRAAKDTEKLLRKNGLYTSVPLYDDPREIDRKIEEHRKRDRRKASSAMEHLNDLPVKLLIIVVVSVVFLCFNSSFREYVSGCVKEKEIRQSPAYSAQTADEALGVSEPRYFDSENGHLSLGNIGNCYITVDHYGFFRNDSGRDCIVIELSFSANGDTSERPVYIPRAVQDRKTLVYSMGDYKGYAFTFQPEKTFLIFEGVNMDGGDISVVLQYIDAETDALDEYSFACPIASAPSETDVVSG